MSDPSATSSAPSGRAFAIPPRSQRARCSDQHHKACEPGIDYTQGALALTYPLPSGLTSDPQSSALTLVQPGIEGSTPPPSTSEAWAARFLQAVVEVVSGDRPLTQLVRWTDQAVYAEIAERKQRVAVARQSVTSRAGRAHVVTVHLGYPTNDSAEVAARVTMGGRSRAIAARLDMHRDRWLCTDIQFG